ncbi:MAG: L,D-transpeptidase family protein [Frankia sp.]|nr:L,D-transpeptidase family protein [Frankia sp.]
MVFSAMPRISATARARIPGAGRSVTRGRAGVALLAGLLAVVLAACGGGGGAPEPSPTTPPPVAPQITITPADGTGGVAVTEKVVVTSNVPLESVTVNRGASESQQTPAGTLLGEFSPDRRTWTSTGGLFADSQYQVQAVTAAAEGVIGTATAASTFATGIPEKSFKVSWEPVDGQVVGVGTPVTLTFSGPTTDRAAVQGRLVIRTEPAIEGAWSWASDRVVRWRPKEYWPSGTKVHVEANLAGLEAGNGFVGVKDRVMDFTIGPKQISYVDLQTHTMEVYQNDQLVRQMPISGGKGGKPSFLTMEGPHNVLGKADLVIMDSATVGIPKGDPEYYYEEVQWAVQYTSGGQYVHSAPWSVASQGRANVSHGCVNASPADAEWFYNFSQFGDIIDIRNSGRPPDLSQLGNDWSIPWSDWVAGSALPVTAAADAGSIAAPPAQGDTSADRPGA